LMSESVCFTQHYTGSPVCNPSRACLLTGRYPHRTGSVDTLEWRGLERLALRERTLADMLKRAGYATGLVGKWHLGAFDNRYHPCNRGFDEAVCFRGGMHDYYDWRLEYGTDVVRYGDGTYLTDLWTTEACDFLRRHREEPFFLHVTYNAPHTPLQVPQEEADLFLGKDGLNWGVATLYGMIHRMDSGIGQLLATLDDLGLRPLLHHCECGLSHTPQRPVLQGRTRQPGPPARQGQGLHNTLLAVEPLHAGHRIQRRDPRRRLEARPPGHRRDHGGPRHPVAAHLHVRA